MPEQYVLPTAAAWNRLGNAVAIVERGQSGANLGLPGLPPAGVRFGKVVTALPEEDYPYVVEVRPCYVDGTIPPDVATDGSADVYLTWAWPLPATWENLPAAVDDVLAWLPIPTEAVQVNSTYVVGIILTEMDFATWLRALPGYNAADDTQLLGHVDDVIQWVTGTVTDIPFDTGMRLYVRHDELGTGAIGTWADQSGNSNDLTQAVAANQPSIIGNVLNGYPVVDWDGANDVIETPANTLTQFGPSDSFTIGMVVRFNALSDSYILARIDTTTGRFWFRLLLNSTGVVDFNLVNQDNGSQSVSTAALSSSTWYRLVAIYENGSFSIYVNNSLADSATYTGGGAAGADNLALQVGGGDGGSYDPDTDAPDMQIAELRVYARALSSTVRAALDSFWTTEFSL